MDGEKNRHTSHREGKPPLASLGGLGDLGDLGGCIPTFQPASPGVAQETFRNSSEAFCPPKPKLLLMAYSIRRSRALCGT
jgi:hypothetical protein